MLLVLDPVPTLAQDLRALPAALAQPLFVEAVRPLRGLTHTPEGAWEAYRRAVTEGRSPVEHEETLTADQRELEGVYLALRTSEGLNLSPSDSDRPRPSLTDPVVRGWVEAGWVELAGAQLRCTPEGWLRLDALAGALTGAGGAG